jgi:hypothetical protein
MKRKPVYILGVVLTISVTLIYILNITPSNNKETTNLANQSQPKDTISNNASSKALKTALDDV